MRVCFMFLTDLAVLEKKKTITGQLQAGLIEPEEAVEKICAIDPDDPVNLLSMAIVRQAQGEAEAAEQVLWQAMRAGPCSFQPYLLLATLKTGDAPPEPLVLALSALAFEKILTDEKRIRKWSREGAAPPLPSRREMEEVVAACAVLREHEPPEVTSQLHAFRLIHELQCPPLEGVDPDVVDDILEAREECRPLLRGVVRAWWEGVLSKDDDGPAVAALALLGEIGDSQDLPLILECLDVDEEAVRYTAGWALRRALKQRPGAILARVRELLADASVGLRIGVAMALAGASDIEGARELLLEQTHDLRSLPEDDRRTLFLSVAFALGAYGRWGREQLKTLLGKYGWDLSPETRELALLAPHPPPPEDLTVYDLCCVPLDDEPESPISPPKRERPGRNDPCWCGSGKKYKKCHLASDGSGESAPVPAVVRIQQELVRFVEEEIRKSELRDAIYRFFGRSYDFSQAGREEADALMQWLLHDYRVRRFGRTPIAEFQERRRAHLTPEERQILERLEASVMSLMEVQEVHPGRGLQVRDVWLGEEFFVHDVSSSRGLSKWDCILSRVVEIGGRREFVANGLRVPRFLYPGLRAWAEADREKKGLAWRDYLRKHSHQIRRKLLSLHERQRDGLQIVTAEGDALVMAKAVYAIKDAGALRQAMEGSEAFGEEADGVFNWLERQEGSGERSRVLGQIRLKSDRLTLECMSRERLERGRALLERLAGGSVRHLGDELTDWRRAMEEPPSPDERGASKAVPPEVEKELVEEFYDQHYSRWPDTPLPALGGRTPREAVRTPEGRAEVVELLKTFENDAERQRREGRPTYDFSRLRAALGIDPL